MENLEAKISIRNVSLKYSDGTEPLSNINLDIPANQISVIFGPANGGKSSLLRLFNRLNDLADVIECTGEIIIDGENVLDPATDLISLRRKVGMVFSSPVMLPLSIRENIIYGLSVAGDVSSSNLNDIIEKSLKQSVLWDDVKDRLDTSAFALSGGQKQRLCLARVIANSPEIILLDEPTSGLDPVSTSYVEQSLQELKKDYTVVLVPHSVQQATRTADMAAFFLQGELVEKQYGKELFVNPIDERTKDYIEGRYG
jgi:phosphate transport system ATP-binding protein